MEPEPNTQRPWLRGIRTMIDKKDLKAKYLDYTERKWLEINWARIGRAIDFYKSLGYRYVEVPWIVEEKYRKITYPEQITFATSYGDLVGSAEQSFIALHFETKEKYKVSMFEFDKHHQPSTYKFVACTPCFRDHQPNDRCHMPYFMKVELFELVSDTSQNIMSTKPDCMFYDAAKFFATEGAMPELVKTDEGVDWFVGGIEIGSYGQRKFKDKFGFAHTWNYATGLAEPRFSQALTQQEQHIKSGFLEQHT